MGAERADVELLTAIQRGDMGALEQLYDRHRVLAYSLALRVVGTPPDAEEVVQEAFLSVWRSAATYRSGSGSVRSWLLSIVRNRAIDRLRSRKSRPAAVALDDETDIPDRADVWGDVLNRLTGEEVRQAMAAIPWSSARPSSWHTSRATRTPKLLGCSTFRWAR
jgi:RNA polymerase sigma-70 factor (ECF subfamily)